MITNREKISAALKAKRKALGLNIRQMAKRVDLSQATISAIERGLTNVRDERYKEYAMAVGLGRELFGILTAQEKKEEDAKRRLGDIEDTALVNPKEALNELKLINIDITNQIKAFAHYVYGICYFSQKKWAKAKSHLLQSIEFTTPDMDEMNVKSVCFNYLGRISFRNADFQKALEYTNQGLEHYIRDSDRSFILFNLLLNKAIYFDEMNESEKSLLSLEELKMEFDLIKKADLHIQNIKINVTIQMYSMYANVLIKQNMLEKALEFINQGIKIAIINQSYDRLFTLWTVKGNVYTKLSDPDTAKRLYMKALNVRHKVKQPYLLTPAFISLGLLYLKKNEVEKSKQILYESLDISKNVDIVGNIETLEALGQCLLYEKNYELAIVTLKEAENFSNSHKLYFQQSKIISDLCDCYDAIGDKENFLLYTEKLYRHNKGKG